MPKLVTCLREGYGLESFRHDLIAGLTVAVVALPLAMALAIASGTTPERGLFTAVIAGFLISALGGSRLQIGGPTGAFVVVVFATIERHGYDGLLLATLLAGIMLILLGLARLGTIIKYIPYPVITGFTSGIAVIIFTSQIKDFFGLDLASLPADFVAKIAALARALPTLDVTTLAIGGGTLALILALRRLRPQLPAFLIAVAAASLAVWAGGLEVETIGSRFGGIPRMLPTPALPEISLAKVQAVLPDALTIALLAGDRIAALGGDRRRHGGHAPSLQLRAGGARHRQHRLAPVRRAAGDGCHRAHRDQHPRGRPHAGRRHPARGVPSAVHAAAGAARQRLPAGEPRGRADRGRLDDERGRALRPSAARAARRPAGAAADLRPDRAGRHHRRGRGRRGARGAAVHAADEPRHRGADPRAADPGRPRRPAARAGSPADARRRSCPRAS